MKLTITDSAFNKINEYSQDRNYLLLHYDTDGCGCGVNGVPTINLVPQKEDNHIGVENDKIATIVDEMQSVFFAENMKLDFLNGMFRLSSPDGILNPFISTTNLTN